MARQTIEISEFAGLQLQANSFSSVPDGGMEVASNIVLTNDKKILKRRGFYEYHDASADTPVSLFTYQNRLFLINTDSIGYFTDTGSAPNKTGTKTPNGGLTIDVAAARPSRAAELSNNLYFTTEDGVLKLEAYNGSVLRAGVPGALDLDELEQVTVGAAMDPSAKCFYRVLFGRRDSENTEYLGAPSDVLLVETPAGSKANIFLEFSVPSELVAGFGWFFQLYRSAQVASGSTPFMDTLGLIYERELTSAELSSGVVHHLDNKSGGIAATDDIFRGQLLYTNPNSREGEINANLRPPLCEDITEYKNHMIYAKTISRHLFLFTVNDAANLVNDNWIEFQVDAVTHRFVARKGLGNRTYASTASLISPGVVEVTTTALTHELLSGYEVYISGNGAAGVPDGIYTITVTGASTFTISATAANANLYAEGRTNGTDPIFWFDNASGSLSERIDATAIHIVKAVNRDSGNPFYANYISLPTSAGIGKIKITAQGFGGEIQVKAVNQAVGSAFDPEFPTAYTTDVSSDNDESPNGFFISKQLIPEAVPAYSFIAIGSKSKVVQRVFALRDSLIILKEEGVFRMSGDSQSQFTVSPLDKTIFCIAPKSATSINNQVLFLSNQGFVLVTESSVSIISRPIEAALTPILGEALLSQETVAVSYESDRHYIVSTLGPNSSTADRVYVYNIITDSWVTWDNTFTAGVVGPNDTLYLVEADQMVKKERKFHTKIDYTGQNFATTVNSASGDVANITVPVGLIPEAGDIIVKLNIIHRIVLVTPNGSDFDVQFSLDTNLEAADSVILYNHYKSKVVMVPFHAGKVGVSKRFSEFQIHLSEPSISALEVSFQGAFFGGSVVTDWRRTAVIQSSGSGWGNEPWGFFPWGQDDVIDILTGTQSSAIIRMYIPRFQGRGTYIQPILEHIQAGERMSIQALDFTVRAYGERTTK